MPAGELSHWYVMRPETRVEEDGSVWQKIAVDEQGVGERLPARACGADAARKRVASASANPASIGCRWSSCTRGRRSTAASAPPLHTSGCGQRLFTPRAASQASSRPSRRAAATSPSAETRTSGGGCASAIWASAARRTSLRRRCSASPTPPTAALHSRSACSQASVLNIADSRGQYAHGWYLVPPEESLETEEPLPVPSASRGQPMLLVLPYSFLDSSSFSFGGASSDLHELGIGVRYTSAPPTPSPTSHQGDRPPLLPAPSPPRDTARHGPLSMDSS